MARNAAKALRHSRGSPGAFKNASGRLQDCNSCDAQRGYRQGCQEDIGERSLRRQRYRKAELPSWSAQMSPHGSNKYHNAPLRGREP
jgi:hypothetical protein